MSLPADTVRAAAPAKVNLFLRVLAREASGFHSLETLFCALTLADEVVVRPGEAGVRLVVYGDVDTGLPERNLCVRAAEAFHAALGRAPAVTIELAKRIPAAAGLGGGSSDAAATLRALDALHGGVLGRDGLLRLAIRLGADVPFFLCGSPLALAWGRGERLLALPPLPPRPVLVAHPGVGMPTPEAFRRLAERRAASGASAPEARAIALEALGSWEGVAALAENDFEAVVAPEIPVLGQALGEMREAGAVVARMAGSGASLFGVFETVETRDRALERVARLGMECVAAETAGDLGDPSDERAEPRHPVKD
jgi:4-diphosphocytidyl-2-C-methyl-D-erythritol kinase